MFDLNADQGDLTNWWVLRGEPMCPRVVDVENISRDVEVLRAEGFEWLFIDCPPEELDIIEAAIKKSDAVIV
ncbi:MAG: ParA family protein, partial [Solimonas sp.]